MDQENYSPDFPNVDEIRATDKLHGNDMMQAHLDEIILLGVNEMSDECSNMIAHQNKIIILKTRGMLLVRKVIKTIIIVSTASEHFWHEGLVQENIKTPYDCSDIEDAFL